VTIFCRPSVFHYHDIIKLPPPFHPLTICNALFADSSNCVQLQDLITNINGPPELSKHIVLMQTYVITWTSASRPLHFAPLAKLTWKKKKLAYTTRNCTFLYSGESGSWDMGPAGVGTKNDCAGEGQQFTRHLCTQQHNRMVVVLPEIMTAQALVASGSNSAGTWICQQQSLCC
jgi:hypothetical protein